MILKMVLSLMQGAMIPANGAAFTALRAFDDVSQDGIQSCVAFALAGKGAKAVEIFTVVSRWLVDTGCGHHLIAAKHIAPYLASVIDVKPITCGTANGATDSNEGLPIKTMILRAAQTIANILRSTLAVL